MTLYTAERRPRPTLTIPSAFPPLINRLTPTQLRHSLADKRSSIRSFLTYASLALGDKDSPLLTSITQDSPNQVSAIRALTAALVLTAALPCPGPVLPAPAPPVAPDLADRRAAEPAAAASEDHVRRMYVHVAVPSLTSAPVLNIDLTARSALADKYPRRPAPPPPPGLHPRARRLRGQQRHLPAPQLPPRARHKRVAPVAERERDGPGVRQAGRHGRLGRRGRLLRVRVVQGPAAQARGASA